MPPSYFLKKKFKVHGNCQNSNPAEKLFPTKREGQEELIFWGGA